MTRVWSEGFEMKDLVVYTSVSAVIDTTYVRSGAASLLLAKSVNLYHSFTGIAELYLRFGFYWWNSNASPSFYIFWRNSGTELGFIYFNGGVFYLYVNGSLVATGTMTISQSAWYLVELHVKIGDGAAGSLELKVDGISNATYTGDTKPGADTTVTNIWFRNDSSGLGANAFFYIDDIGLNDTAGAVDNSWCGDGHITVIMPDDDSTP